MTRTVVITEHVIRRLPDDTSGRYLRAKLADQTNHRTLAHKYAEALRSEAFRVAWDAETIRLNDHAQLLYAARLESTRP